MGSSATCLALGGSHFFLGASCWVRPAFGSHFGSILGQRFGHDLALGERSRGISGISLCRISLRIFLDGSGLSMGPWHGHFLLPSWSGGEGREKVEKSRKMTVLRMMSSIVENVPTPRESIFKLFPASQLPYRAKIQIYTKF